MSGPAEKVPGNIPTVALSGGFAGHCLLFHAAATLGRAESSPQGSPVPRYWQDGNRGNLRVVRALGKPLLVTVSCSRLLAPRGQGCTAQITFP